MPVEPSENERLVLPESDRAARARGLVESLQHRLVETLERLAAPFDDPGFGPVDWLRDGGRHGGGRRYATELSPVFNRVSINVSSVHYDDIPDKPLASATALSAIIHPAHPRAPSMHTHISFTELRDDTGYWRLMADLNPSLDAPQYKNRFDAMLEEATGEYFQRGQEQGERYFYIPALGRHRGVSHFYLEGFDSGDFDTDRGFAEDFGVAVIDEYTAILADALDDAEVPADEEKQKQLAYHTLYFFQVLTLDRGTTSGLLVHDQNDIGILASLPAYIDRKLLNSWIEDVPAPQNRLVENLLDALPDEHPCRVGDEHRAELATVVREHYRAHPEAGRLLARGDKVPPTVNNHGGET